MNRIGFQFNNSDEEDIFKVFDEYVDSSKEKLTKAADNLMKLYKFKDLDEDSRKKLIDFEKKLRMVFKQVDEIDKEVEEMARRKRMEEHASVKHQNNSQQKSYFY